MCNNRQFEILLYEESLEKLLNNDQVKQRMLEIKQCHSVKEVMQEQFDAFDKFIKKLVKQYHIKIASYTRHDFDTVVWQSIELSIVNDGVNVAAQTNHSISDAMCIFLNKDNIVDLICDFVQFQCNNIETEILSNIQANPDIVIRCNVLQ